MALKYIVSIVFLLDFTASKLIVKDDEFHGYLNGIYHKKVDKTGYKWNLPTSQSKLEILENDFSDNLLTNKTCKNEKIVHKMHSKNISFEEVAQFVGFKHVHREMSAQKPNCQFDTVISGAYNFSARFEGQGCMIEQMTGGVAAGDYDNDGLVDIFFTVFHEPSLLYRNNGDDTFTDVTRETGVGPSKYGNGAGWIDVDSDGDLDLYVTTVGGMRHHLYINQNGRFTEEAVERGISLKSSQRKLAGFTPAFGDFDRDGFMDIYTTEWIMNTQAGTKESASRLFRNKGKEHPGYFEDVTDSAGVNIDDAWSDIRNIHNDGTHTLGASFTDFDNDGWPELFIVGDFGRSKMFWNNKNSTFSECTEKCGIDDKENAMGYTTGDINGDGQLDLFITGVFYDQQTCALYSCKHAQNHNGNGLYINNGGRKFTDVTNMYAIENSQWGFGSSFIDFDNDGQLDIVTTNGFNQNSFVKDNMNLFHNKGSNKKMVDVALDVGMKYDGMGRGVIVLDYDNDGDEDVLTIGNVGMPKLFKNNGGNSNNWIKIRPMQRCENTENMFCDSYGAVVTVSYGSGMKQTAQVGSKSHFLGQNEVTCHFGVNKETAVQVTVTWPRLNKKVMIENAEVNRLITVYPPNDKSEETILYSQIERCQHLRIKEITQQPQNGKIIINPDGRSVKYDTGDYTIVDVGVQYFRYSVEVFPTYEGQPGMVAEGTVTIDFRGKPEIFIPECKKEKNMKPTNERRFDGVSNNKDHVMWGAVNENLLNIAPHAYADNISEPASACTHHHKLAKTCPYPHEFSGVGSTRPSAREISNKLMAQTKNVFSKRNLSDFTMHFGQFISHDIDHSTPLPKQDFMQYHQNQIWMPITIPKGDVHFDPYNTGKEQMPFIRTTFSGCSGNYGQGRGPRKQFNTITAFIDANIVYGVDEKRAKHLREFKNGKLRMRPNLMLPKNEDYMKNANPVGRKGHELYIAGDVRVNVQPGLAALHTLFVREHNRLAREYIMKNPIATDEQVFKHARKMLIAELQAITYNEYLPALLGGNHLPQYTGYKKNVKSGVTNEFATAVFRYGHSQVNKHIFRLQENGEPIKEGHALLREMYFMPNRIELEGGLDPIFRGALKFPAQEIDLLMVDEMRNVLFKQNDASASGKSTGFDLAAFNIQRGRDHGLSDFNTVRKKLGLKGYTSFYQITSDEKIANRLKNLYRDINNIDLWVGGLAEDHVAGSELGETFHTIMVEQFTRIRDGDRFWYKNVLTDEEIEKVEKTTLSKIIRYNTGFDECPDNVFFATQNCIGVEGHQCVLRTANRKESYEEKYNDMKVKRDYEEKKSLILTCVSAVLALLAIICLLVSFKITLSAKRNTDNDKQSVNSTKGCYDLETRRNTSASFDLGISNAGVDA